MSGSHAETVGRIRLVDATASAPAAASWRFIVGGVIVTTLLIPPGLYRFPIPGMPMDVEAYRLFILLLLAMWGTSLLVDETTSLRPLGIDGSIAFLAAAISLSFAVNLVETRLPGDLSMMVKAMLYLGAPIALLYAINSVVRSRDDVEWALKLIVWLGAVIAALGMVERATQFNVFDHFAEAIPVLEYKASAVGATSAMDVLRIAGPSLHAIAFSVVLGMTLPLAIHYARSAQTWLWRISYSIAAVTITTTMFLTGSRTAFVAFMVILVILWLSVPQVRKWTVPGLFVLAVVLHFAFPGAIGTLLERLSPGYLVRTETGNQAGRVADYARVSEYYRLRPLLGMGFGTFDPFTYFWVDNQYLVMVVEIGLMGLAAFLTLFVSAFRLLYGAGRRIGGELGDLAAALSASVAVFAVTSVTYDSFGFPQVFNLFFIILALGTSLVAGLKQPGGWSSPSPASDSPAPLGVGWSAPVQSRDRGLE